MPNTVLNPADVEFIEEAKKQGALIKITPQTFQKVHTMIYVMCNSGPELQDRLMFAWKNIAEIAFPVMTFGGIIRLSATAQFFDEGVIQGVKKVVDQLGLGNAPLGGEFHYPCKDACDIRCLNLKGTILHGIEGHAFASHKFGRSREVYLFGHFTYNGGNSKREMETFLVEPELMGRMVV